MNVCLVTCVCGRHIELERVVRCFLNQDYKGNITHLIYNNSPISLSLADGLKHSLPLNRDIILVNNHLDYITKEEYTNTGAIFRDALTYVPRSTNVVNFFDSDDIFLPNHVDEGVKQFIYAVSSTLSINKKSFWLAYKPYYSYCLYGDEIFLDCNNMEPSVFVDYHYVKNIGFDYVAAAYHQKWLDPLMKEKRLYQPKEGVSTFIYNWKTGHNTHKISGLGDTYENFRAHRQWEQDNGDRIITPSPEFPVQYFYNLVKDVTKIKGEN